MFGKKKLEQKDIKEQGEQARGVETGQKKN